MKFRSIAFTLLACLGWLPLALSQTPEVPLASGSYLLDDFETTRPLFWPGRPGVGGDSVTELSVVHQGKRSISFSWDISNGEGKGNNFFRMNFEMMRLVGAPVGLDLWVHADQDAVGTEVNIGLVDAAGAGFRTQAPITTTGWSQIHFPLENIPNWSDAKFPVSLSWFGVDTINHVALKGKIYVDDVSVSTTGTPRDLILARVVSDDYKGISFGKPLDLRLQMQNLSNEPTKELNVRVEAADPAGVAETYHWDVTVPAIEPGKSVSLAVPFAPELPNGAWNLSWKVADDEGELQCGTDTGRFSRLFANNQIADSKAGPAEKIYAQDYNILGGAFAATPEQISSEGAAWVRYEVDWKQFEPAPQQYNLPPEKASVDKILGLGMNVINLTTLYGGPEFYKPENLNFAPAYGRFQAAQTQALADRVEVYELGNEDNGPSKFIYTEIGRNGAAGVRSRNFEVPIANSGTAGIDIAWLNLQKKRGLFDRLDVVCTHPYTGDSSPEAYDLVGQLDRVNDFIDQTGGMKFSITTEWGYHAQPEGSVTQIHHAQWMPRHLVIAAASGLLRHGLYAYDLFFGIYTNGYPYPSGVSVNAYYYLTSGYNFAGWLEKSDAVWAAVFEKAGDPLIIAWSTNGESSLSLDNAEDLGKVKVFDLYGNSMSVPVGERALTVSESPIYVSGLSRNILRRAWLERSETERARFLKNLERSPLAKVDPWRSLASKPDVNFGDLSSALSSWSPKAPLDPTEQAVIAQALRWIIVATKLQGADVPSPEPARAMNAQLRQVGVAKLRDLVSKDCDLPSLRWLLKTWDQLEKQQALCIERGNNAYANRLAALEPILDKLSKKIAEASPAIFYPIWPYVYASNGGGRFQESLQLTPGKPVRIAVRLNSYSAQPYPAELRFDVPPGWKVAPAVWKGNIAPGSSSEVRFDITADENPAPNFAAVLRIPQKPEVRIPLDNFRLLPAFEIESTVLSGLLPQADLPLTVFNNGMKPFEGQLRLLAGEDLPAYLKTSIAKVAPGRNVMLKLELPPKTPRPAFNRWPLVANVVTPEGKEINIPLTVDFDVCVEAAQPVQVTGEFSQWVNAAPLHLDKEKYTYGSYSDGWTPSDLSGTVYTQWDTQNFYLAADVVTPVFNQALSDAEMYKQDSVQFALAAVEGGPVSQFGLALTPKGLQVWDYRRNRLSPGAKLDVKVKAGHTIYQVSIPWSEMPEVKPARGKKCRFDVVFNHWDVSGARRYVARYGPGIIQGGVDPKLSGWLNFSGPSESPLPESAAREMPKVIFREDFEEYDEGEIPATWQMVSQEAPVPTSVVRSGLGRDGGKALEMTNTVGVRPFVFRTLSRPLAGLVSGKKYRISAWVKGAEMEGGSPGIGVCSDLLGNEGFVFIPSWNPSPDWQQVSTDFIAPAGAMRMMLRNANSLVNGLLIDDVEIVEAPE